MSAIRITIDISKEKIDQLNLLFQLHGKSMLPNEDLAQLVADINKAYPKLNPKKEVENGQGTKNTSGVCVQEPASPRGGLVRAVKRGQNYFA